MATIRKHRDKYQARVRRKGYPAVTKSFSRLSDAKEWAREIERQADRRELAPISKELDKTTLADLVRRYRAEVVPRKKGGDVETIVLTAFLREPICRKRLSDLCPEDFTKYRDRRLKSVAPATLKRQLNPIRHMFRHAREEWGIPLRDDPLAKIKLTGADKARERRLRDGELDSLLSAAKANRNPYVVLIVRFALETAMRRGEILSLRWRDIDSERYSAIIHESKNGHARIVPLSPAALDVLTATAALSNDSDDDDLVFPVSANALKLSWVRLMTRAGLGDLHFHDLRHEAISRLFEIGLTVPEVASVSGHRDMRMLLRYAHANHASIRAKLLANTTDERPSAPENGDREP